MMPNGVPGLLPVSPNGLYTGGLGPGAYTPQAFQLNPLYSSMVQNELLLQ